MGHTIFDLTGRLNPTILSEKLFRQQWKQNSFGLWVAPEFLKATKNVASPVVPNVDSSNVKFSGSPIEAFRQFVTQGKTTLDIPIRVRLTGKPVFGSKALEGTEETAKIVFRTVRINMTRKAYSKPSLISAQITIPYLENLMTEANDYLTQWWNDYHPGNFIVALTGGSSIDLINTAVAGGRGVAVMSHPHLYIMGGTKVAYTGGRPGTAGYETACSTAIDACNSATNNALTVARISALVLEAQRQRIAPILLKAGFKRFAIWISDAQWMQLQSDPNFKDFYKRLPNELDDHPLATGARADLMGAIIYVDQNLPHAATNTNYEAGYQAPPSNKVWYWPQPTAAEYANGEMVGNMIERRCTLPRKVGFLIGQSALSVGIGVPVSGGKKGPSMQFVDNTKDYGAIQGIGIATIQSVVRNDVFDQDGMITGLTAGDFYENTSSLVFVTYSPDELLA